MSFDGGFWERNNPWACSFQVLSLRQAKRPPLLAIFPTSRSLHKWQLTALRSLPILGTLLTSLEETKCLGMEHVILGLTETAWLKPRQVREIDWRILHFSLEMSRREDAMRDVESLPRSPGERFRVEFREAQFSLLVQYAGLQIPKSNVFSIMNPDRGGTSSFIFPHKLRLDLASRTIILDCAVLPLYRDSMSELNKSLNGLIPHVIMEIRVDDAELSMWKQVLPSMSRAMPGGLEPQAGVRVSCYWQNLAN